MRFRPFCVPLLPIIFLHLILIMAVDIIYRYFPDLTDLQRNQLAQLDALYRDWNAKINVISRKDIDNIYEHHVLHSLGIARVIQFRPGTQIMDIGTGGGFPGIPLAILFPECRFKLIDSIGKKPKWLLPWLKPLVCRMSKWLILMSWRKSANSIL